MARLHGRAGRLTAFNGGCRPGQWGSVNKLVDGSFEVNAQVWTGPGLNAAALCMA
jgi:hypothetical protein